MHVDVLTFIQDLAIVMLVAGLMTVLCYQFKQPIVLGYIIAGIIIGPHTPPFSFISKETTIKTLAELGVIFLLFSLGLEFNLKKLKKVGVVAFVTAFAEIILMLWLGYQIGIIFGWKEIDAIFLGAILAISSTTIIIKALDELGLKQEKFSQLIFGILIVEDIFAIVILALLSSIAITGSLHVRDVMVTVTKLSSFLAVSLVLGILLVPRFLAYIAKFASKELLLISVLGICFGFCLFVVKLNYSVALGAFVIGAIISESHEIKAIEYLIQPLRDMFSAIFFVSVGLLFNLNAIIEYALPITVITLAVIIGKILSCSFGAFISGEDGKTSMRIGMGLAQIGEFSFIIAALGITLNVTSDFLYSIAVAVSAITTLTTPYLIKHSDAVTKGFSKIIPEKIAMIFSLYTTWLQGIQPSKDYSELRKIVYRSLLQIVINLLFVTAIFLSSEYIATTFLGKMITLVTNESVQKTMIWSGALVVSLPFLVATYRKINVLSMLLAELPVKEKMGEQFNLNRRKIISSVIPFLAIILIMAFISALSISILPPIEFLIFILIIVGILIALLFPWFIRLHAKLQITLLESFRKDE